MIDFKSYNISKIHYQIRPLFMSDQLQFIRKCDRIAAFSNTMHVSFAKVGWRNCNSQHVRWSSGNSTTATNIQKTKENILFYSSYISKLYSICIIKEEKEKPKRDTYAEQQPWKVAAPDQRLYRLGVGYESAQKKDEEA